MIETDHAALTSVSKNRYMTNRIYRWTMVMQEYEFEIGYVAGKENLVADAMTSDEECKDDDIKKVRVNVLSQFWYIIHIIDCTTCFIII